MYLATEIELTRSILASPPSGCSNRDHSPCRSPLTPSGLPGILTAQAEWSISCST